MNVSVVQSALGTMVSTPFARSTSGPTATSWGAAASYQSSSSSSSTFFNNNYNSLADIASLQGLSATTNQVALNLAMNAGSTRETEKRSEIIDSAVDALDSGDTAGAREIAQGMLDENGNDSIAAHLIARTYMEEKNYADAEKYFGRASLMTPSSQRFSDDLETVRLLQKDDERVIEETARMIRQPERRGQGIRVLAYLADRSPDNTQAHMMLGDAMMSEGWPGPAVSSYRNAIVAADETDLDKMVLRFRQLADAAPDAGVTHSMLGQALQKQGEHDEAFAELKQAARLAPENTSYQQALGSIYGDLGFDALDNHRPADAIRYFQEATALNSGSELLKSGLAQGHLGMAKWFLSRGLDRQTFDSLNSAKLYVPSGNERLKTDLARNFNTLGNRYNSDGELDWAISSYKRAYDLDSDNFSYRSKLAIAYDARGTELFDEGEYEKAETNYQNALDLFSGNENYQAHVDAAQAAQV